MSTKLSCSTCSRRTILRGLGVATVGALLGGGCTQAGSDLPTATTAASGAGVSVDLADPNNVDLTTVGGAMLVDALGDTIMVIRHSTTAVIALSAICTHSGCSMNYDATQHVIDCPCHGSQFSELGQVTQGPAQRSLKVYTATLADTTITVEA